MKFHPKRACAVAAAVIVGLGAVVTGGTAQAATASNHASSYATWSYPSSFDVEFQVRQLHTRHVDVSNEAEAVSTTCTGCRSIAIAFQIVTDATVPKHVHADNYATAVNTDCAQCQTLGVAYQFIVAKPTLLDFNDLVRLYQIDYKLHLLRWSDAPAKELAGQIDALAHDVASILAHAGSSYGQWPIIHRFLSEPH
jgi:putative peptide zinc metalloprotease protein